MSDPPEPSSAPELRRSSWSAVLRSFGTLAVGEGIARMAGLVAVVVMARELKPSAFGLVVVATTLVSWFATVADSGTETITMRNVSRQPERFRSISDQVLGLRLALSGVAMVLFAGTVLVASRDDFSTAVLLPFALVLPALALNLRWIVLGVEGSRSVAAGNVASQLLFMIGVLLLISVDDDATRVSLIRLAAELLYAAVVLGWVARRFGLPVPRFDVRGWRRTLGESLPIMGSQVARSVIYGADMLLIAALLGSAQAGLYGAAYGPVLFLAGAAGLFSVAFLSSYSAARSDERRHELASRALRLGAAVALPVAALATVASPIGVPLVYGDAYDPAVAPFAILVWTIPLMALTIPYTAALVAADRQRTLMRHNVVGAALNVAANLAAIPLLGINAAAAITVLSFALVLALNHRSSVAFGLVPALSAVLHPAEDPLHRRPGRQRERRAG